ncbi:MAG: hypothetical protein L6Q74_20875 [Sphaerotilus natans subsp. sulfidivorans]|uniref:DUF6630 family protein n=1 Tax=Sphaerotilus sulfidivorans TaxID=639200 RepID=UPI002354C2B5|nr:hypothetical protein [Sphaerotilus sulfidivorans]MCK6404331.1 hypothetical protein [Sphaerotilus sulfidivorans]
MLKFLGKLLNRHLTMAVEPIDVNVPEEEIIGLLPSTNQVELLRRKKKLQDFLRFATRQLDKNESQRLCRVAKRVLADFEDSFEALSDVLLDTDGQRRGHWVLMQLDWRDREEIVWQVSEILFTFGISERWEHDCGAEFRSTSEALQALSDWLSEKELALLHFETNSDFYCSMIVRTSEVSAAKQLALDAQLTLYDHAEFFGANTWRSQA